MTAPAYQEDYNEMDPPLQNVVTKAYLWPLEQHRVVTVRPPPRTEM